MSKSSAGLGVTLCVQFPRLGWREYDVPPVQSRHVIAARVAIVGAVQKRVGDARHAAWTTAHDRELIVVVKVDLFVRAQGDGIRRRVIHRRVDGNAPSRRTDDPVVANVLSRRRIDAELNVSTTTVGCMWTPNRCNSTTVGAACRVGAALWAAALAVCVKGLGSVLDAKFGPPL